MAIRAPDGANKYIVYFQTFQIDDIEQQQPIPTWLFLFPEGTRLSPAKLEVTLLNIFKRMQLKVTLQFFITSFKRISLLNTCRYIYYHYRDCISYQAQASQEFAASRGLPILKHHLVPRFCILDFLY